MHVKFRTSWQHWREGQTYDLPDGQADALIKRGFAIAEPKEGRKQEDKRKKKESAEH